MLVCLLLAGSLNLVRAQGDVELEVHAPLKVVQGDQFRIEFSVSAPNLDVNAVQFTQPAMNGLNVLAGPVPSNGVFSSFINGADLVIDGGVHRKLARILDS